MNKLVLAALIAFAILASVAGSACAARWRTSITARTAPDFTLQAAQAAATSRPSTSRRRLRRARSCCTSFRSRSRRAAPSEAHLFSEHVADFAKLGAQVIGVSGDDIETQKKFSTQECRSAFLVASDPGAQGREGVRRRADVRRSRTARPT